MKHAEDLRTFKKISVSDSDQESISNSSSEEGEVWKIENEAQVSYIILTIIIIAKY